LTDRELPGRVRSTWPRFGYGFWPELERIEVTDRAANTYDESSSLEHRIAKANGESYGSPPRHWEWDREKYRRAAAQSDEQEAQR